MSQQAVFDNATTLAGLIHENFVSGVQPLLDVQDAALALFEQAGPGEFSMVGEKLVFAVDPRRQHSAMATPGGQLPDHVGNDALPLEFTPTRMYVRRAVDNFWGARATGDGAFQDFLSRVMTQMWDDFRHAQIRHVHGSSSGVIAKVAARTSTTVVTIDDGYGLTGVDPSMFLEIGDKIAWLDASNSFAVGGVGVVSDISVSGIVYTLTLDADWENGSGTPQTADGDVIVRVTTDNQSASYFTTEYGAVPLGLIDHLDVDGATTTYGGATVASYDRMKPVNMTSATFDEVEIMKFVKRIMAKSQSRIDASSNTMLCNPAVTMQLARTLLPYSQIQREKGQTLPGGWETVQIANFDFVEDTYAPHNILYCLCREDMRTVPLDGAESIWAGDGSEFSRVADFDGKEWFAKRYVQRIFPRRNRSGVLKSITTTEDMNDFTPSPYDVA